MSSFSADTIKDIRGIPIEKHTPAGTPANIFNLIGLYNPFVSQFTRFRAPQSGVVQLKVIINRICPFRKAPREEHNLIFNLSTIEPFPEFAKESIEGYQFVEGITLKRKYVYRHNFLVNVTQSGFEEIDSLNQIVTQVPNYKPHTTWTILPSFYAKNVVPENVACSDLPDFTYSDEEIPFGGDNTDLKNDGLDDAPPTKIQLIHQQKTQTCSRDGVHWSLGKNERLFKGQDFFIEFFRRSGSRDLKSNDVGASRQFTLDRFKYLDASLDESVTGRILDTEVPVNLGVAKYKVDQGVSGDGVFKKVESDDEYLFTNQAYVVIELGWLASPDESSLLGQAQQHYFIIITDRGSPIFVVEKDQVSFRLSTYDHITGGGLFGLKSFKITVQNYLGKFLIHFDGPGLDLPPWVIERLDVIEENGEQTEQSVIMFVPKSFLFLYGGNLPIAFVYGPLQYQDSHTLNLPPRRVTGQKTTGQRVAESGFRMGLHKSNKHFLLFSATDDPPENLSFASAEIRSGPFFTNDAQKYIEFNISPDSSVEHRGTFYGQRHYKAVGQTDSELSVSRKNLETDEATRLFKFDIDIEMKAGTHAIESVFDPAFGPWRLESCVTPILTMLRLIGDDEDPQIRWEGDGRDVTDHVMSFSDSWAAQDFNSIEHTGNITFLLNRGAEYDNDQTEFLQSLIDKTFYIEVWAGYKNCNYSGLNGFCKMFTGLCHGGSAEFVAGKTTMVSQITDYNTVLENQIIFNSPFFDGVKDFFAMDQLLNMAGFRSRGSSGEYEEKPGFLIEQFRDNPNSSQHFMADGRVSYAWPYALPSGYSRLQDPKFKFEDGSNYLEAIKGIAKRAGKLFYFDQHGIAHYENYLDMFINNFSGLGGITSPSVVLPSSVPTPPAFWFSSNPSKFTGQQVFNKYSVFLNVADVRNHIKILSNTPNFTPIFADELNWDSFDNPESEGFIGYLKTFFQKEGAFGTETAIKNIVHFYTIMFRPPVVAKFETYGQPIRALDFIVLNHQPYRVMRVDSTIDPAKNVWWQNLECEWFQKVLPLAGQQ